MDTGRHQNEVLHTSALWMNLVRWNSARHFWWQNFVAFWYGVGSQYFLVILSVLHYSGCNLAKWAKLFCNGWCVWVNGGSRYWIDQSSLSGKGQCDSIRNLWGLHSSGNPHPPGPGLLSPGWALQKESHAPKPKNWTFNNTFFNNTYTDKPKPKHKAVSCLTWKSEDYATREKRTCMGSGPKQLRPFRDTYG